MDSRIESRLSFAVSTTADRDVLGRCLASLPEGCRRTIHCSSRPRGMDRETRITLDRADVLEEALRESDTPIIVSLEDDGILRSIDALELGIEEARELFGKRWILHISANVIPPEGDRIGRFLFHGRRRFVACYAMTREIAAEIVPILRACATPSSPLDCLVPTIAYERMIAFAAIVPAPVELPPTPSSK